MNRTLVAMIGVLVASLLVGRMFGFVWAGGEGYEPQETAKILQMEGTVMIDRAGKERAARNPEVLERGEIVRTGDAGRATVSFADAYVLFLDERTNVRLDRLSSGQYEISLIQGRAYAESRVCSYQRCAFSIATPKTQTAIQEGAVSIVNYNFKQTVGIMPINTIAAVIIGEDQGYVIQSPVEILETDGAITDITFDPENSAAAEFYRWVGLIQ